MAVDSSTSDISIEDFKRKVLEALLEMEDKKVD